MRLSLSARFTPLARKVLAAAFAFLRADFAALLATLCAFRASLYLALANLASFRTAFARVSAAAARANSFRALASLAFFFERLAFIKAILCELEPQQKVFDPARAYSLESVRHLIIEASPGMLQFGDEC